MAELGLAGSDLAAAFLVLVLASGFRAARHHSLPAARYAALASSAAIAAILSHSTADFNLYVPANLAVLTWIAGIAAAPAPSAYKHA